MARILFVEDDDYKLAGLLRATGALEIGVEVAIAKSFTSAAQVLKRECFDLVVLDMSLPTFDATEFQGGGDAQGFGGRRVVRIAEEYGNSSPTILVTQFATYEEPGERMSVSELAEELGKELGVFFFGTVAFDRAKDDWMRDFQRLARMALAL